jgi:hypothetical protein
MANWLRKRSPRKQAIDRATDKADARRIMANPRPTDLMKYHSPRSIAAARARGESNTRTPREAAQADYKQSQRERRAGDRYPTGTVQRHNRRRSTTGRVAGGRKFSLKRANVARSKTTGRFIKRA